MSRFYVFKSLAASLLGDAFPQPSYVLIPESDIKTGRFVRGSNPLLGKEAEAEVEGDNMEDARRRFMIRRANAFS